MLFYPDNFFYFITLFLVSTSLGTYLLLSYNRSQQIILNAMLFYLVAIRCCSEYYLQQLTDYQAAVQVTMFQRQIFHVWRIIFTYLVWSYTQPFHGFKWKKQLDQFFIWGVLFIPSAIVMYAIIFHPFKQIHPEPIANYWRMPTEDGGLAAKIFIYYAYVFTPIIILIMTFKATYKVKGSKIKRWIGFFIALVLIPYVRSDYFDIPPYDGKWVVANLAFIFLAYSILWILFLFDYRFFRDGFDEAKKDLLDSISDWAISTDLHLNITHANDKVQKVLNVKRQSIIGLFTDISTATSKKISEEIQALVQQTDKKLELSLELPNSGMKTFLCKATPLNRGNSHVGYIFLLQDLTSIREKERQLEEANNMKDQLFAIIGHDLRKPTLALRNIGNKVNYLIQQNDIKRLSKLGSIIEKNALAMNKLIDNLLNWSLLKKNNIHYFPDTIDLESITKSELVLFNPVIEEKQLELSTNFTNIHTAQADINSVRTIIRNLVDNAVKYTPSCGQIHIYTKVAENKVHWAVEDSGYGIAQEKLATLFQLQDGKSEADTMGQKGTGLGLHLVQELLKVNKGDIAVNSELNKGTTFEFTLPKQE